MTTADSDAAPLDIAVRSAALLEWPALLARLADHAATPAGKERCLLLTGCNDPKTVETWYAEVAEWTGLHEHGGGFSLDGGVDPRPALHAAVAGGMLDVEQCREIALVLDQAHDVRRALARRTDVPRLAARAAQLDEVPELRRALADAVDAQGRLRESATPELFRLRREVDRLRTSIVQRVEGLLGSPQYEPWLQDGYVTQREERYVLPIKIEHRTKVSGIVHDLSSSGATLFIEPAELVDANNDLKWAEMAVGQEIERILRRLTELAAASRAVIETDIEILTALDIIQAKGRFGLAYRGAVPTLSRGTIGWRGLRHPLLALRGIPVVGNDVVVDPGVRALVISGPNTGGKTVLLKAMGLAALMTRAGLPLACEPGSESPLLPAVLMDVGDDQDLGRDLSTFAAHIRVVGAMLAFAPEGGLVLIDELATATDPDEGSALARAVLEAFVAKGVLAVVTTHYTALKAWAAAPAADRMSAGMGYDVGALAPTYRLTLGRPGASLGLDVAARLGLSAAVLDRARALVDPQTAVLARAIAGLERERGEAADITTRLAGLETAAREAALRQDAAAAALEREREAVRADRKARLAAEVDRAKRELDRLIEAAKQERDPRRLRALRPAIEQVGQTQEPTDDGPPTPRIEREAGAAVRVRTLGAEGTLIEATRGRRRVRVRVDDRDVSVDPSALEDAAPPAPAAPAARGGTAPPAAPEETLKLIGARVEEALERVDRALDAAAAGGLTRLRVVHGHGSGRLKTALRAHLAASPYVAAHRPGEGAEGGDAVTIVTLA
ncbi:MAG: Smr/MutS family protein [Nitrospiria bacterium]